METPTDLDGPETVLSLEQVGRMSPAEARERFYDIQTRQEESDVERSAWSALRTCVSFLTRRLATECLSDLMPEEAKLFCNQQDWYDFRQQYMDLEPGTRRAIPAALRLLETAVNSRGKEPANVHVQFDTLTAMLNTKGHETGFYAQPVERLQRHST